MQLSLSKKDVAQVHVMLSTLPIPPMPIIMNLDMSGMPKDDTRTTFEMATVQIVKDAKSADQVVNSYSIIASMSFFTQWTSAVMSTESKKAVMHKKEAVILSLIKSVIDYSEKCKKESRTTSDDEIYYIFLKVTNQWVANVVPEGAYLEIQT